MTLGSHKTRCGLRAIVAQIKPIGMKFVVRGAVEATDGALCLQAWDIYGVSIIGPEFDLVDA